ncbi:MAG: hypothetical protein QUS33_09040, partial [Dehalococcoidia bacterium]|nr:hypothetical protein [Dehalococcoidia bacterium]
MILTLLVFVKVLKHEFVRLDDYRYILSNLHVHQGLAVEELVWALTSGYASNWHPLTWISHMTDVALYGPSPAGHHLTSLVFHIANVLLLFLVLYRMTGYVWRSGFVAALFAIHPLHVESVAWVAERKDVLSTFFWFLTMLAYAHYVRKPGIGRYALVFVLLALGLMSKPMLVSVPLVLLIMDYWPLGRMGGEKGVSFWKLVWEKAPLFVLSAASSVVTYLVQRAWGAMGEAAALPLRIENAVVSYVAYLVKTVWPARLAVLYPFPWGGIPLWKVVGSVILLALMTFLVVRARKTSPYLA